MKVKSIVIMISLIFSVMQLTACMVDCKKYPELKSCRDKAAKDQSQGNSAHSENVPAQTEEDKTEEQKPDHKFENLIVFCMDPRLASTVFKFLNDKEMLGKTDIIAIGGFIKAIAENKDSEVSQWLLERLDLAYNKHGVRHFILTQHDARCGAYNLADQMSQEQEKEKLIYEMRRVNDLLLSRYPDLKTDMYWIKASGSQNEWAFEPIEYKRYYY